MNQIKIKYCGLRSIEDVQFSIDAKINAVGFVFVETSKRYITPEDAVPLMQLAQAHGLITVALFANHDAAHVNHVIFLNNPDVLQFHGSETAVFCEQFERTYWKAVPMSADINYEQYLASHPNAAYYLLDAYGGQQTGGSGKTFDWFKFPENLKPKLILAGGINASNIQAALAITEAEFIDASSGIESSPGVKSKIKMLALADLINPQ